MNRLRIWYIHYGDNWIRGSEQSLLDVLTLLDRSRFEPVVWCNQPAFRDRVRELGVEPLHYTFDPIFNWKFDPHRLPSYLAMVGKARRYMSHAKVDLIHCHSGAPAQWLGPAARLAGKPFVVDLQCPYSRRERYALGLHLAPAVAGCARAVLSGLLEDGYDPTCAITIHNGVD